MSTTFRFSFEVDYGPGDDVDVVPRQAFDRCARLGFIPNEDEMRIVIEPLRWSGEMVYDRRPQRAKVTVEACR